MEINAREGATLHAITCTALNSVVLLNCLGATPPLRLEAPGAIAEGAPPSFNVSSAAAFLKVSAAAAAAV